MDASPHALREPPARPIAPPVTLAPRDPRLPWIVAIAAMLPFLGWWTYGLFDLDEGIYAAIVGEMIRRHEWITPYFNGAPWYEKPILIYWAAIPFVKLLGPMVGPRVSAILATWGTMGLVAWFSRRHLAPGSALIAPLVLATSLLVVGTGREGFNRLIRKQCRQWKPDPRLLGQHGHDPRGQQRGASQICKTVVDPHAFNPQHLAPNCRQTVLQRCAGWDE